MVHVAVPSQGISQAPNLDDSSPPASPRSPCQGSVAPCPTHWAPLRSLSNDHSKQDPDVSIREEHQGSCFGLGRLCRSLLEGGVTTALGFCWSRPWKGLWWAQDLGGAAAAPGLRRCLKSLKSGWEVLVQLNPRCIGDVLCSHQQSGFLRFRDSPGESIRQGSPQAAPS